MKTQQFLEHHGVASNPFAEEDAQTDPVFKDHCIASTYHPSWDKVYGNPAEPSTSIVFGEKGAGKTALRLQIVQHLLAYNQQHPAARVYVIQYDDFNPFLDRFAQRLSWRFGSQRALEEWKLWDHIDALLSLGVTGLVDRILEAPQPSLAVPSDGLPLDAARLDRHQARDLLLLAACYDQSTAQTIQGRWNQLRKRLRFSAWKAQLDWAAGVVVTLALTGLLVGLQKWAWLESPWVYLAAVAGWAPWMWRTARRQKQGWDVARNVRVGKRPAASVRKLLMHFSSAELAAQPLPDKQRTDDRYELLAKFQGILRTLGFAGIVVLVDRVDEPHLINGGAAQMRSLLWPMLDNKFLKHQGMGIKLLLPIELAHYIDREDRDFHQRARLDKQNMIPSLEWTGEALYDVAKARLAACAAPGRRPVLRDLFEPAISDRRITEAFRMLRVPRHLFKFFYRLLVMHCNAYTDENPSWQISSEHFESALALYLRDQEAFDRGVRAG